MQSRNAPRTWAMTCTYSQLATWPRLSTRIIHAEAHVHNREVALGQRREGDPIHGQRRRHALHLTYQPQTYTRNRLSPKTSLQSRTCRSSGAGTVVMPRSRACGRATRTTSSTHRAKSWSRPRTKISTGARGRSRIEAYQEEARPRVRPYDSEGDAVHFHETKENFEHGFVHEADRGVVQNRRRVSGYCGGSGGEPLGDSEVGVHEPEGCTCGWWSRWCRARGSSETR